MYVQRKDLIDRLYRLRHAETDKEGAIKLITGLYHCGKSSLVEDYILFLKDKGIRTEQIMTFHFERLRYDPICDPAALYNYIVRRMDHSHMNYLFLQEIRFVPGILQTIDSLSVKENLDIYITCSDEYFEREELPQMLFGKIERIHVLPLSLSEYGQLFDFGEPSPAGTDGSLISGEELYTGYVSCGGLPYLIMKGIPSVDSARDYMQGLYSTILVHDIIPHRQITDTGILEYLLYFLSQHTGELLSPKKISDLLRAAGRPINARTVDSYIEAFAQTFLLYRVRRYDLTKEEILQTLEKYYPADSGFTHYYLGIQTDPFSVGCMENMIFLEMKRRGYDVYLGKIYAAAVSFVCMKSFSGPYDSSAGISTKKTDHGRKEAETEEIKEAEIEKEKEKERIYIQVIRDMADTEGVKAAVRTLEKIKDNYPKLLISGKPAAWNHRGIRHVCIYDFLISPDSKTS